MFWNGTASLESIRLRIFSLGADSVFFYLLILQMTLFSKSSSLPIVPLFSFRIVFYSVCSDLFLICDDTTSSSMIQESGLEADRYGVTGQQKVLMQMRTNKVQMQRVLWS